MLVNYFCGVAGRLKSLARQAQVACKTGTKGPTRQAQNAGPAGSNRSTGWHQSPAPQSQPPALSFPQFLVLQVPNILWLVVDRDRLNLGVV